MAQPSVGFINKDTTIMKEFVGSQYCYQGEKLALKEIVFVRDHHYNEQQQHFPLDDLLQNGGGDHTVIFDHVLQHDDVLNKYNFIFFPSFMSRECKEFGQQQIIPNWNNKCKTFNFMINKPRPHREMLLRLVEEFDLNNYCHSLAWRTNTINDIPVTDYRFGPEVVMDRGVRNGSFRNAHTYQALLQTAVFESACISLITEPVYYERETIVTEKTIMAMYGGTLPIWVGGWRIPSYLKSIGFDVFDDIIDHSYQDVDNPENRCRLAIELNYNLLSNFEQARYLVEQNHARLNKNLELLKQNIFHQMCLQEIDNQIGPVCDKLVEILGLTTDK